MIDWRKRIDEAAENGEVEYLFSLLDRKHSGLTDVDREHITKILKEFATGKRRRPRGRPKKPYLENEKEQIAQRVFESLYGPTIWRRALGEDYDPPQKSKVEAAIVQVANEMRCSRSKVWACWTHLDKVRHYMRLEQRYYDALDDVRDEAERDAAVKYLTEEHGSREFSDDAPAHAVLGRSALASWAFAFPKEVQPHAR